MYQKKFFSPQHDALLHKPSCSNQINHPLFLQIDHGDLIRALTTNKGQLVIGTKGEMRRGGTDGES